MNHLQKYSLKLVKAARRKFVRDSRKIIGVHRRIAFRAIELADIDCH